MRHIRARKRFKLILIFLFTFSFILFLEDRVESFAPQLKTIVETKVGDAFDKKIDLSIGDLNGGILHPFTLNNVRIIDKKDSSIFSSLEIKSIRSNYHIWDVFLKGKLFDFAKRLMPEEPCIYINFSTKNDEVSGFVRLKGNIENAELRGSLVLFKVEKIALSGTIKDGTFDLELKPKDGVLTIVGSASEDGYFVTNIKANHLKVNNFDVVCEAVLKNRVTSRPGCAMPSCLEGELETKNFILNYSPSLDMKASYRIYDGILDVTNLILGDHIKIHGKAALREPYNITMAATADNVNLTSMLSALGIHADNTISGIMNGKLEVKGPVKKLRSHTHIEIRQGALASLDFEYLNATLKGEGPMVRIEDSRITRQSGYFTLAGEIDFSRIGKASMFQKVKLTSDDKAIMWDLWNVEKVKGVQEIKMTKKMSEEVNLGFKKFVTNEKVDESVRDKDEIEVEYKMRPKESLKMMVGDKKEFFGFQYKDKF